MEGMDNEIWQAVNTSLIAENARLNREVERLNAHCDKYEDAMLKERRFAEARINELRTSEADALAVVLSLEGTAERLTRERDEARAEVERLRSYKTCLDHWQLRFGRLRDVWSNGDNADVLDAVRVFLSAEDGDLVVAHAEKVRAEVERLREGARDQIEWWRMVGSWVKNQTVAIDREALGAACDQAIKKARALLEDTE